MGKTGKFTDYELLLTKQCELANLLDERRCLKEKAKTEGYVTIPRSLCKSRIHSLRLELNDIMSRIEKACETYSVDEKGESWYE